MDNGEQNHSLKLFRQNRRCHIPEDSSIDTVSKTVISMYSDSQQTPDRQIAIKPHFFSM
jgi:hypothetical protein